MSPRKPRGAPAERVTREVRPRPVVEGLFVSCPFCCMSRKLDKTGGWARIRGKLDRGEPVKGRSRFGIFDLDDGFLIQIRDCSGSRGHGFPLIGGYTLDQLKGKTEFAELLAELKECAENLLKKLE